MASNDFRQKRRHSITNELNLFAVVTQEPEINREGLKRCAFTDSQRPVFRWVKKIAKGAARDRLRRFIGTNTANSCWCTPTLLGGRAIHHTAECSPFVTFVPQFFRQITHPLAGQEQLRALEVVPSQGMECVVGDCRVRRF